MPHLTPSEKVPFSKGVEYELRAVQYRALAIYTIGCKSDIKVWDMGHMTNAILE